MECLAGDAGNDKNTMAAPTVFIVYFLLSPGDYI